MNHVSAGRPLRFQRLSSNATGLESHALVMDNAGEVLN